jgi:hypothetical protein
MVVEDDPEAPTVLVEGVLEEDRYFDTIAGVCIKLGRANAEASAILFPSSLMISAFELILPNL